MSLILQRRMTNFALGVIIAINCGCVLAVKTYYVSNPVSESPGISIRTNGWLSLGSTILFLAPTNYVQFKSKAEWIYPISTPETYISAEELSFDSAYYFDENYRRPQEVPSYFIFEIFFLVKKKPLVFSPLRTLLQTKDGDFHPMSVYFLQKKFDSTNRFVGHRPYWELCGGHYSRDNPVKDLIGRDPSIPLTLQPSEQRCLAIKFPTHPPDPRDTFHILFEGIAIDGKSVPVRIKYIPETVTQRHA